MSPFIGCAGWSIPGQYSAQFPVNGSHLERYATELSAVEINSSFYRPHQMRTYERWAAATPPGFRFAVKVPKTITHERRLRDADELVAKLFHELAGLGSKLGPLLVQLPPSLRFERPVAETFFGMLRTHFHGPVACEPRHVSWFTAEAGEVLAEQQIARVAADPATTAEAVEPGGWQHVRYYRLHGSPRMYYSQYSGEFVQRLADRFQSLPADVEVWCIFDNTAAGAALGNALELQALCAPGSART